MSVRVDSDVSQALPLLRLAEVDYLVTALTMFRYSATTPGLANYEHALNHSRGFAAASFRGKYRVARQVALTSKVPCGRRAGLAAMHWQPALCAKI